MSSFTYSIDYTADSEEPCAICFEPNCDYTTYCKHFFHYKCLKSWYQRQNTCPNCRKTIEVVNRIKKYVFTHSGRTELSEICEIKVILALYEQSIISGDSVDIILAQLQELQWNVNEEIIAFHEVDCISPYRRTREIPVNALTFACMHGRMDAVQHLLSLEADVNFAVFRDYTALHAACEFGHLELVSALLNSGAKIADYRQRVYVYFTSPLHVVSKFSSPAQLEIFKLLLLFNPHVSIWVQDQFDLTPLYYACRTENVELVDFIIKQTGIGSNDNDRKASTSLHVTCHTGNMEIYKRLIIANANINAVDINEDRPLHMAALYNRIEIVKDLLARGAKVNPKNKAKQTPLAVAFRKSHTEIVEILKSRGGINY